MKMGVESVKIINSIGKQISAAVHYPRQENERLAILCPGYLDSKDYSHLVCLAEDLSSRGYVVVRFDPIGTWESEGVIADYTITRYLEDVKNVLEYMLGKKAYKQVLLGGHSRGGQVSILYGARDSRVSAVLGIMPSSSYSITPQRREEWRKNGFEISWRDIPGKTEKIKFRVPYSHVIDRDNYDVVENVKKLHVPLILVAGELDTTVLPENVKRIFDSANEPKKFILLPGIGHDYRHNPSKIKIVNNRILKELSKNLK